MSAYPDGSDSKTILSGGRKLPDGVAVEAAAQRLYWTNMGNPKKPTESIFSSDLNGQSVIAIVPPGGSFSPKRLQLDKKNLKLYWCEREGMRVMRSNLDGSQMETLVDRSDGDPRPGPDARKWCVDIAVHADGGMIYWTQKGPDKGGQGRLFRPNISIPQGQTAASRKDIELLYDNLPEPIDLELDIANRTVYWTDRGDPTRSIGRLWMRRPGNARILRSFYPV